MWKQIITRATSEGYPDCYISSKFVLVFYLFPNTDDKLIKNFDEERQINFLRVRPPVNQSYSSEWFHFYAHMDNSNWILKYFLWRLKREACWDYGGNGEDGVSITIFDCTMYKTLKNKDNLKQNRMCVFVCFIVFWILESKSEEKSRPVYS